MDQVKTKGNYTLKSQRQVLKFMISTLNRKLSDQILVTSQSILLQLFKAMVIGNDQEKI